MVDGLSVTLEELAEKYYSKGDATRKGWSYLQSYAQLLEPKRQEPLRILELGVFCGASLLVWHDYLPHSVIVGIDIANPPARILSHDRIHFLQGSQDDPALLDKAAAVAGGAFDLIVDDASHIGYLTKRSFLHLFPRWLVPGGHYVIEDFGTGYMSAYPDGQDFKPPNWHDAVPGAVEFRSSQHGMTGVVKQLIDYLMQELMTGTRCYIAISRLTIETNVAFIEKSLQPGGNAPELIPELVADAVASTPDHVLEGRLAALTATVKRQGEEINQLQRVMNRLRRMLTPIIWLRRLFPGPGNASIGLASCRPKD